MTDVSSAAGAAATAAAPSSSTSAGASSDGKAKSSAPTSPSAAATQGQSEKSPNAGQQDREPTTPAFPTQAPHQSQSGMVRRPSSSFSSKDKSASSSRRGSQMMLPPPTPLTNPPFAQPPSPGGSIASNSETGVGTGPGPARLPKPLTPAEIHAELEKEQEAAVNRLTRQLSILRAQQVGSPTTNSHLISDDVVNTYPPTVNLGSRSRRTSSNASTALTTAATVGTGNLSRRSSLRSLSSARAETQSAPAVPSTAPGPVYPGGLPLSRTSSVRSIGGGGRDSGRNSPALGEAPYPYFSPQYYHAMPTSSPGPSVNFGSSYSSSWRERDGHSQYAGSEAGGSERGGGVGLGVSVGSPASESTGASRRYEEVVMARSELENVRKENERLRERIRELERGLDEATKGVKPGGAEAAQATRL